MPASIQLILCQDKKGIIAEYALKGVKKAIGVSEYQLTRALPKELRSSLPTVEEMETELTRLTTPKAPAKPHHDLRPGDVLVCTTNSGKLVGKCTYFDLPGRYAFSNHLTRLRPKPDIMDGGFLRWNLWLHWKRAVFNDKCKHWVNPSTIPKDVLLETGMVVPPLREQRRIVAKLEKLLGRVDACQQRTLSRESPCPEGHIALACIASETCTPLTQKAGSRFAR